MVLIGEVTFADTPPPPTPPPPSSVFRVIMMVCLRNACCLMLFYCTPTVRHVYGCFVSCLMRLRQVLISIDPLYGTHRNRNKLDHA